MANTTIVNAGSDGQFGWKITKRGAGVMTLEEIEKTVFGELITTEPTPIVQIQFHYNVNTDFVTDLSNNGTASIVSNMLNLSTGAGANQSASIESIVPIKYNPGQGASNRFTAVFTTGVANSTQYIGVGSSSDGYFFGFNGTTFGVMRRQGGVPEVRNLTVTTGSSTAEDITITLDGNAKTDVSVTNTADTTLTAAEIAAEDYSDLGKGWIAHVRGDIVTFQSVDTVSGKTGTYSLSSATSAVGSFASELTATDPTETVVASSSWSEDKVDGTGALPTIDFTKGNVYQIKYQWLGFGIIEFYIEHPADGGYHLVHRIEYANANTAPSIDNPILPLFAEAKNTSNTSDIVLQSGSMGGFIEGTDMELGSLHGTSIETTGTGTTELPILSIHNHTVYQSQINRVRIKFLRAAASADGTKPSTVRLRINTKLTGASFSNLNINTSVIQIDTSATALSGGGILFAFSLDKTGTEILDLTPLNIHLDPGQTLTISSEASSGTVDNVVALNWKELF